LTTNVFAKKNTAFLSATFASLIIISVFYQTKGVYFISPNVPQYAMFARGKICDQRELTTGKYGRSFA